MIRLKAADDQESLDFELLQFGSNFVKFTLGQRAFGAQECAALSHPTGYVRPMPYIGLDILENKLQTELQINY